MPASIEDVARRANVSISTVSRVLNRRHVVNAQTRQRVEQAIAELNYRPNVFARGLMLQQSNLLALVLPDMHGEFYSEIIRGANQQARELGYQLLVSSSSGRNHDEALWSVAGRPGLADGLVAMVSETDSKAHQALADAAIPIVVLDGELRDVTHDGVAIDQRAGAQTLVKHLVQRCEARRIVFVGGGPTNIDTLARLAGCQEVMRAAGLQLGPRDVFQLDFSYEQGFALAAREAIGWAESRACVFAANDEMAAGILAAAAQQGIGVPDPLRVVGFDDTRIARMTRPQLTTVHVPMASMGAAAVELLSKRLRDRTLPVTRLTLHSQLVVRESCGAQSLAPTL